MPGHLFRTVATFTLLTHAVVFAADQPNIVLVMADDQGWGDMGYYGHPVLKTPNFDAAAAAGLRFDRFYAAAPVCSPTRASVLTGRHPNRMGVFRWGYPIRPQEITLAEVLKKAGYATGHFGKWHLGSVRHDSPVHPGNNGFDQWLSAPNFFDNDPILSLRGKAIATQGESSQVTANAALEWITDQAKSNQPFLAVIWFGSPHKPHRAAEEDRALYRDQTEKLQNFYGEIAGMDRAFGKLRKGLTNLGIRENTVLWYCSDNGALPQVGSTGNHRGEKGDIYEGGLLVPAILEWPKKVTAPRITDVRCSTCDIYPTLLAITGVKPHHQPVLDGIDLSPLIEASRQPRKRSLGFWSYPVPGIRTPSAEWMGNLFAAQQQGHDLPPNELSRQADKLPSPPYPEDRFPGHAAWIEGDWKLHRIADQQAGDQQGEDQPAGDRQTKARWELYQLARDPREQQNVIDEQTERAAAMREAMEAWLKSVTRSLNGADYL